MSGFRNKLSSSRPGRIFQDVRSRISPIGTQKAKRHSRKPSPSRERSRRSSGNTSKSDKNSTQSELNTSSGGVLGENLAESRSSRGSASQPSAHTMGNNIEKVTRKKVHRAKLLPIRQRPRIIPWSDVQWNSTAAMWEDALARGQDSPDMGYTGARVKRRKVCKCGGKCAAGSSGSSRQESSSCSSPQSSGLGKTARRKELTSALRQLLRRGAGPDQAQSPFSSPRGSSDSSQKEGSKI